MNKTMNNFQASRLGPGSGQMENMSATSFYIQSKDKRHQMHAPEVKQFIIDDNIRRRTNRKKSGMIQHEAATSSTYNQNEMNKKVVTDGTRFNLNDTMPLGGIGTNSINNMTRQKSSEAMRVGRADAVE